MSKLLSHIWSVFCFENVKKRRTILQSIKLPHMTHTPSRHNLQSMSTKRRRVRFRITFFLSQKINVRGGVSRGAAPQATQGSIR